MNRALAAILITLVITPSAASAQTRLEDNKENIKCEWFDLNGNKGIDTCHITSQGTEQGETSVAFRIGDRKFEYVVSDAGWARLIQGEKTIWEGKTLSFTYKDNTLITKTSDGVTVRLHYK